MERRNAPKFSIVIPAYNVSDYLPECLNSVLEQNFRDIEVICVDDCSTDNTLQILEEYARKDPRVRVIAHEHNQGVSAARNTGIAAAAGQYIMFVDSDDYHIDGSLQLLNDTLQANELDLLLFEMKVVHDSGSAEFINKNPAVRVSTVNRVMTGRQMLSEQIAAKEYICSVFLQVVRSEILKDTGIRFFPGVIHEDEMHTPLVMEQAQRAMCINDRLYVRRIRDNSIMTSAVSHKNVDGYFAVSTGLFADYIANGCVSEGVLSRAKTIHTSALKRYRMLTEEEQAKAGKALPDAFRFLFTQSAFGVNVENLRLQEELTALKKKHGELKKQYDLEVRKNRELSADYNNLLSSRSYRVGRLITAIPRKIASVLRNLKSR